MRHGSTLDLPIWPRETTTTPRLRVLGGGAARRLAGELRTATGPEVLLVDGTTWESHRIRAEAAARGGATVVVLGLPAGSHTIDGVAVEILPTTLGRYDFASRATGHPLVEGFEPDDFRFWHRSDEGMVVPFVDSALKPAEGWAGVLRTGAGQFWGGPGLVESWACAERTLGAGRIRVCCIDLTGRVRTNPAADRFARRLLSPG
jgi:hypothetical protein